MATREQVAELEAAVRQYERALSHSDAEDRALARLLRARAACIGEGERS